jgi:hypothetical protein
VHKSALPTSIRAGKLRALAVTTATRADALPDLPTVGDFVPGYEASYWMGLGAPKNTPTGSLPVPPGSGANDAAAAVHHPRPEDGTGCFPGVHLTCLAHRAMAGPTGPTISEVRASRRPSLQHQGDGKLARASGSCVVSPCCSAAEPAARFGSRGDSYATP